LIINLLKYKILLNFHKITIRIYITKLKMVHWRKGERREVGNNIFMQQPIIAIATPYGGRQRDWMPSWWGGEGIDNNSWGIEVGTTTRTITRTLKPGILMCHRP
jgi:hypothetical protein